MTEFFEGTVKEAYEEAVSAMGLEDIKRGALLFFHFVKITRYFEKMELKSDVDVQFYINTRCEDDTIEGGCIYFFVVFILFFSC